MNNSRSESYAAAGVDITAGYKAVELMKQYVARTITDGVCSDVGGFGGLFELPEGMKKPVLVSGTDGVGTKLKLAFIMDKHDTVGIDCVAMCVNDVICSGAKPLFFLDYIACGKNIPEKIAEKATLATGDYYGVKMYSTGNIENINKEFDSNFALNHFEFYPEMIQVMIQD